MVVNDCWVPAFSIKKYVEFQRGKGELLALTNLLWLSHELQGNVKEGNGSILMHFMEMKNDKVYPTVIIVL